MVVLEKTSTAVHYTGRSVSGKIQTPEELQQKPSLLQTRFQAGAMGDSRAVPAGPGDPSDGHVHTCLKSQF